MNTQSPVLDIKAFRDQLISKKTLAEQQIARANEAKKAIKEILGGLTDSDINKLESAGIYVKDLLRYDLDLVMTDVEINLKFREDYIKMMRQIQELVERESKVK